MTTGASATRTTRRSGRRPGESGTRDAILAAARRQFAAEGFDRTTIRGVAGEAGVDPALVLHYFGSKDGLFSSVIEWPVDLDALAHRVVEPGLDGIGERLIRFALDQWQREDIRHAAQAMIRSSVAQEQGVPLFVEFARHMLLARVTHLVDPATAEIRGGLVATTIAGLFILRHVVPMEPLASASTEELVAAIGPTLQRYLAGDIGAADRS